MKRRVVGVCLVGMLLAIVSGCGRSPARIGAPSPDGSIWIEMGSDGRGRVYIDGRAQPEDIGVLEGQWWVDWFGPRDVVLTDIGSRRSREDYGVHNFGDVRVEVRAPVSRGIDIYNDSGSVLHVAIYDDSRGMHAASLKHRRQDGTMIDQTVLGEGPWSIKGEWLSSDVLQLSVQLGSGVPIPSVPNRMGGVDLQWIWN